MLISKILIAIGIVDVIYFLVITIVDSLVSEAKRGSLCVIH